MSNQIRDAFDSIKADDDLKIATKQYLSLKRNKKSNVFIRYKWIFMACALFILAIGINSYYKLNNIAVSYISIDVNPSIELTLNKYDKVIDAIAYNDDGAVILNTVSVKSMDYIDAINAIIENDAMYQYLSNDNDLTFTIASNNRDKENYLKKGISSSSSCQNHGGQSQQAKTSLIEEAHENEMSFGKYKAYLALLKYDSSLTVDECKDMTMSEIHSRINEHEQGNDNACNNQHQGHHNKK